MLVAGAILFLMELSWYWLAGTIAWFAGFGVLLGWAVWRAGTLSDHPGIPSASGRKR
ncbi:MAG TPA: hypothetical protein VFI60_10030 [Candidatus Acidoferrum sp.]|jgi:hypothetical protein|nr:hypothetical protein [Candidatus Acidoferrum sp.]